MSSSGKQECIKTYIAAWNAADAVQRTDLLSHCFAEHGTYVDPHVPSPLSSRAAMNEMIATFRSRLNHELKLLAEPDLHNDVFRFQWKLENSEGILSRGMFVGTIDPSSNQIGQVIGFLDKE